MRPCIDYMELMNAVLDGEATPAQEAELTAHLTVCPPCAALFEDLKALREGADVLVAEAPAGFTAAVMEQVRAEGTQPRLRALPRKSRRTWRSVASVAAVCALILLGSTTMKYFDFASRGSGMAAPEAAAPAAALMDSAAESRVYGAAGDEAKETVERSLGSTVPPVMRRRRPWSGVSGLRCRR